MKINRHGQSKILTPEEIELLFSQGLQTERDRVLFSVCLFSACRVAEACSLVTSDVYSLKGEVIGVNLKKVAVEDLHLCKEKRKALATCKGRT
jgi:integrase